METFANQAVTTLSAAISSVTATSCTVIDATAFPATGNFRIKIDSEILIVTGRAGNTFTITRGAEGTTAPTHASGASVIHLLTKGSLEARVGLSDATGRNDLLSGATESAISLATAAGFTVARAAAATSEIVILDAAGRNNLLPGSAESAISLATTAEVTAARAVAAESALALVDAAAYIGGELVEATAESALVLDVAAESAISLTVAAGRNNIVAAAATSVLDLTDRSGPVLVVLEDLPEQDPRVEQNLSTFLADLEDEMGVGVRTGENPGRFGIVLALFER